WMSLLSFPPLLQFTPSPFDTFECRAEMMKPTYRTRLPSPTNLSPTLRNCPCNTERSSGRLLLLPNFNCPAAFIVSAFFCNEMKLAFVRLTTWPSAQKLFFARFCSREVMLVAFPSRSLHELSIGWFSAMDANGRVQPGENCCGGIKKATR